MTPTNYLRFVEREAYVSVAENGNMLPSGITRRVSRMILQQWWHKDGFPTPQASNGEWRDVPVEVEQ